MKLTRLVWAANEIVGGSPAFVYGVSSSVGLYGIQMAKPEGPKVLSVASKHNHELLRSIGTDVRVDYHDDDWSEQCIAFLGKSSIHNHMIAKACGATVLAVTNPQVGGVIDGVTVLLARAHGDAAMFTKCKVHVPQA